MNIELFSFVDVIVNITSINLAVLKSFFSILQFRNRHWHPSNISTVKKGLGYFSVPSMDPFVEYLKTLKSKIPIKTERVSVVIGNESCDLDSTVCSLTLAYFLNETNSDSTKTVLPILNVLESEFLLRTENIYVLNSIGIKQECLIYKNTIDMEQIQRDKKLEVTLVDHHVLPNGYAFLKDNVKQILDHRPLDIKAKWKEDVVIDRRIVGSCCTLIADKILKQKSASLTPFMAKILYETIIFDTIGLSEKAGKVKDMDIVICKELEGRLFNKPSPSQLFDELWAVHNDVSALTPKQLLAKDLKVINNILIPGLPMLVRDYLKKCDILKHIQDFCIEKKCDHMILMGLEAKEMDVKRDIAFFSCDKESKLFQDIITKLKNFTDLDLQEECCSIEDVKCFRQNPKLSRKQIVPQIQEVLELNK